MNTQKYSLLDLVPITSGCVIALEIAYYKLNSRCYIEVLSCPLIECSTFDGPHFLSALGKLRKEVELKGYKIACMGCLENISYSRMLLEAFDGLKGYIISDMNKPVSGEKLSTFDAVDEQMWPRLTTIVEWKKFQIDYRLRLKEIRKSRQQQ